MDNSTLFGAIVAAIVLPAAFAYWITDVPAPARKPQEARSASPAAMQRPVSSPALSAVVPATKTESFAFSPVNPFGSPTAAPAPRPATGQSLPQSQRTALPPVTVAAENDSSGN